MKKKRSGFSACLPARLTSEGWSEDWRANRAELQGVESKSDAKGTMQVTKKGSQESSEMDWTELRQEMRESVSQMVEVAEVVVQKYSKRDACGRETPREGKATEGWRCSRTRLMKPQHLR